MKKINFGRLVVVWDWVEQIKWLSFFCGFFITVAVSGVLLLIKNINFNVSLSLLVMGLVGFLGCSSFLNLVINKNHKV